MAEQDGQEKTEQPTSKRRREARERGSVLQSKEIATVVMLLGVFFMMRLLMPFIYRNVRAYLRFVLDGIGEEPASILSYSLFASTVITFCKILIRGLFCSHGG